MGVTESLPLSDALDQTCCLRGPLGNHLDLLPAGSECETSGFRCSCKEGMARDQSSSTERKGFTHCSAETYGGLVNTTPHAYSQTWGIKHTHAHRTFQCHSEQTPIRILLLNACTVLSLPQTLLDLLCPELAQTHTLKTVSSQKH